MRREVGVLVVALGEIQRAFLLHAAREGAYEGLDTDGIKQAAEALGATLRGVRRFDPATSYGIVKTPDHAAVLRRGLVLDRDTVWDWDEWRKRNKGRVLLLTVVE